jgi:hypothetical protein
MPEPAALLHPSRQNLPAGHGEQIAEPFKENVPGVQDMQDFNEPCPTGAYAPAGHSPNSADVEFERQYLPAGHGKQKEEVPVPKSENEPALQIPTPELPVEPSKQ